MLRTLCTLALSLAFALPAAAQCGNPVGGPTSCAVVPNSTGLAGEMCVEPDSPGKLKLTAYNLPANQPGQFIASLNPSTTGIPFQNGAKFCLNGAYYRQTIISSDAMGVMTQSNFDPSVYGWGVGTSVFFSAYYRDSAGPTWPDYFNFTNAWKVTL